MFPWFKIKGRGLSDAEKAAIPEQIARGIDLDKIQIIPRKWTIFTPKNITVTRGYKIFYPTDNGPSENVYHLAHIVHEVVHVWQYIYKKVGLYSLRWLNRQYHYELGHDDRFKKFGLEQQAALIEDHYRQSHGLTARWAINDPDLELLARTVMYCDHNHELA
ncbi:MAG: hypothetical protein HKN36_09445 [Hellea sp.]|nr:hypothetical protein [Hellea sp.]